MTRLETTQSKPEYFLPSPNRLQAPIKEIQFAQLLAVVQDVGRDLVRMQENHDYEVSRKPNGTVVTTADFHANHRLTNSLLNITPGYDVVSEECDKEILYPNLLRWFVDPLNGTESFIKNEQNFNILMGLTLQGRPIFGFVYYPHTREAVYGGVGIPPVRRLPDGKLIPLILSAREDDPVTLYFQKKFWQEPVIMQMPEVEHSFGDGRQWRDVRENLILGAGTTIASTYDWEAADLVAGCAILAAMGGYTFTLDGKTLVFNKKIVKGGFISSLFKSHAQQVSGYLQAHMHDQKEEVPTDMAVNTASVV